MLETTDEFTTWRCDSVLLARAGGRGPTAYDSTPSPALSFGPCLAAIAFGLQVPDGNLEHSSGPP